MAGTLASESELGHASRQENIEYEMVCLEEKRLPNYAAGKGRRGRRLGGMGSAHLEQGQYG